MKILLTAFEPFDGKQKNASVEAVSELDFSGAAPVWEVSTVVLPVIHRTAAEILQKAIDDFSPDVILCFGEAGGRPKISLERVAINLCDFTIPDNGGNQLVDVPVMEDGPAAYFSTLPLKSIETVLRDCGYPVEISFSAGAYLCNEIFYRLMHKLTTEERDCIGGFIHLPVLPETAANAKGNLPSMAAVLTREAVVRMIETCAQYLSARAHL